MAYGAKSCVATNCNTKMSLPPIFHLILIKISINGHKQSVSIQHCPIRIYDTNIRNTRKMSVAFFSLLVFSIMVMTLSLQPDHIAEAQLQSSTYSNSTDNVSSLSQPPPSYSDSSIPDLFDKVKVSVVNNS
jgi:hypothetical protein